MFNAPIAHRSTTRAVILLALSLAACGPEAGQSEAVPSAGGVTQTPNRVVTDLVALYEFSEGSGPTVLDTSGVAPLLDLTIEDPTAVTWTSGGLSIDSPTVISSVGAATKLIDAAQTAEEVTVEAWVSVLGPRSKRTGPYRERVEHFVIAEHDARPRGVQQGRGPVRSATSIDRHLEQRDPGHTDPTGEPDCGAAPRGLHTRRRGPGHGVHRRRRRRSGVRRGLAVELGCDDAAPPGQRSERKSAVAWGVQAGRRLRAGAECG